MSTLSRKPVVVEPLRTVRRVEIEWSLAGEHSRLRWVLEFEGRASCAIATDARGSERDVAVIEEPCRLSRDEELGLVHLDLPGGDGREPLLAATFREHGPAGGPELLYARTSILRELGVAGGCSEIVGFSVRG